LAALIAPAPALALTETFTATGKEQSLVVPAGVYDVHAVAVGGHGGAGAQPGGAGAQVSGELAVTPGETLYVEVGSNGSESGGFNGGGNGGGAGAGGGGGASDIRTVPRSSLFSVEHRLLVAAGGGGGGGPGEGTAGAGGAAGTPGGTDSEFLCVGGAAGTSSAGGTGGSGSGAEGGKGELGGGGNGGTGGTFGGGGGAGLYGGGGGGGCLSDAGAGGGGGSSLTPAGGILVGAGAGVQPQVEISYVPPQGFTYTGGEQTFMVPAGVSSVHVEAVGGRGGSGSGGGGAPAEVTGELAVTPGETLYVEVGGNGSEAPGFNGGGNGGGAGAGGGGGASDIRTASRSSGLAPDHRLLVAAGGGGGGGPGEGFAGGGGAAGSEGGMDSETLCTGGAAGTQSAGGIGGFGTGAEGAKGELGLGGSGGTGGTFGGGAGGGLYGGGGGGGCLSDAGGGGGGGSSLVPKGGSVQVAPAGSQAQVYITYTAPAPTGGGTGPKTESTGPPHENPAAAPVITSANQSVARWREGSALAAISKKAARVPVGTVFTFALNEAASVTFSFVQSVTGRKVGKKCQVQSKGNRHKASCKLSVPAGSLTFSAHAGTNKVSFAGKLSASKKLKIGSYLVGIRAKNAQNKLSAPKTLSFTIVK
jgi:hypothetical protein